MNHLRPLRSFQALVDERIAEDMALPLPLRNQVASDLRIELASDDKVLGLFRLIKGTMNGHEVMVIGSFRKANLDQYASHQRPRRQQPQPRQQPQELQP